MFIEKSGITWR